jgi:hypothetical protein
MVADEEQMTFYPRPKTRDEAPAWIGRKKPAKSIVRGIAVPPQKISLFRSFRPSSHLVDAADFMADAVLNRTEPLAGHRDSPAVREVSCGCREFCLSASACGARARFLVSRARASSRSHRVWQWRVGPRVI